MYGRLLVIIPIILFVLNFLIPPTFGKEFPAKPIEIVCNMSPGSIADLTCRLIADLSQKYLGSPVIVINKVGAGGSIAAADVINSKPDGYKLVYLYNTFFVSTVKIQKVPFDPNDLVPIADFVMIRTFLL